MGLFNCPCHNCVATVSQPAIVLRATPSQPSATHSIRHPLSSSAASTAPVAAMDRTHKAAPLARIGRWRRVAAAPAESDEMAAQATAPLASAAPVAATQTGSRAVQYSTVQYSTVQ